MSAFTGPDGERVAIFGEGGVSLSDEPTPLLGKVPRRALRVHADEGTPSWSPTSPTTPPRRRSTCPPAASGGLQTLSHGR